MRATAVAWSALDPRGWTTSTAFLVANWTARDFPIIALKALSSAVVVIVAGHRFSSDYRGMISGTMGKPGSAVFHIKASAAAVQARHFPIHLHHIWISGGGEIISAFGLRGDALDVRAPTALPGKKASSTSIRPGLRPPPARLPRRCLLLQPVEPSDCARRADPEPFRRPAAGSPGSMTLNDPLPKFVRKGFSHACWPKVPALGFNQIHADSQIPFDSI